MSLWLILVISVTVSAGVWLLLSRDLFRIMMGLAVLSMAVNTLVFYAGRPGSIIAPVIESGHQVLSTDAANPLSQALVLTAIVIGFALLCFSLVLAAMVSYKKQSANLQILQESEPQSAADSKHSKPPIMETE